VPRAVRRCLRGSQPGSLSPSRAVPGGHRPQARPLRGGRREPQGPLRPSKFKDQHQGRARRVTLCRTGRRGHPAPSLLVPNDQRAGSLPLRLVLLFSRAPGAYIASMFLVAPSCTSRKISAITVEKSVGISVVYAVVTHDSECFSGLHCDRAFSGSPPVAVIGYRRDSRKDLERSWSSIPLVGKSACQTHVVGGRRKDNDTQDSHGEFRRRQQTPAAATFVARRESRHALCFRYWLLMVAFAGCRW
jgi:hypothetical protein